MTAVLSHKKSYNVLCLKRKSAQSTFFSLASFASNPSLKKLLFQPFKNGFKSINFSRQKSISQTKNCCQKLFLVLNFSLFLFCLLLASWKNLLKKGEPVGISKTSKLKILKIHRQTSTDSCFIVLKEWTWENNTFAVFSARFWPVQHGPYPTEMS